MRKFTVCFCVFFGAVGSCLGQTDWLQNRDKLDVHGTITFTRTDAGVSSRRSTEKLAFASDGRYLHEIVSTTEQRSGTTVVTFVKGTNWRYMERKSSLGTEVSFVNADQWPRDENPTFFLVEKPCFAIGLGLSKLQHPVFTASGNNITVTGDLSDGTSLKAQVGADRVPSSFERSYHGRVINRWQFEGVQSASKDLLVPNKSTYQLISSGNATKRVFTIATIDLSSEPPKEQLTTNWFRPGVTILDRRVDPAAMWTYDELKKAVGGANSVEPEKLLELSRQKAQAFMHLEGAKRARQSQEESKGSNGIIAFALITGVTFVLLIGFQWFRSRSKGLGR
jgi:hypothetical protein